MKKERNITIGSLTKKKEYTHEHLPSFKDIEIEERKDGQIIRSLLFIQMYACSKGQNSQSNNFFLFFMRKILFFCKECNIQWTKDDNKRKQFMCTRINFDALFVERRRMFLPYSDLAFGDDIIISLTIA